MKAVITKRFGDYTFILKDPSYDKIKEVSTVVCRLLEIEVRDVRQ